MNQQLVNSLFPLPAEVLHVVFEYLHQDAPTTLYHATLVCRQWWRVATPILYSNAFINGTYSWATFVVTLRRKNSMLDYPNFVRSVDLSRDIFEVEEEIKNTKLSSYVDFLSRVSPGCNLLMNSKGTKPLVIKGFPTYNKRAHLTISSLIQFAETCKHVEYMNLSHTELISDQIIEESQESALAHTAKSGMTVKTLTIEDALKAIGKNCKDLRRIELRGCNWFNAKVLWMFAEYCPNLVEVDAGFIPEEQASRWRDNLKALNSPLRLGGSLPRVYSEVLSDFREEENHNNNALPRAPGNIFSWMSLTQTQVQI